MNARGGFQSCECDFLFIKNCHNCTRVLDICKCFANCANCVRVQFRFRITAQNTHRKGSIWSLNDGHIWQHATLYHAAANREVELLPVSRLADALWRSFTVGAAKRDQMENSHIWMIISILSNTNLTVCRSAGYTTTGFCASTVR